VKDALAPPDTKKRRKKSKKKKDAEPKADQKVDYLQFAKNMVNKINEQPKKVRRRKTNKDSKGKARSPSPPRRH